MLPLELHTALAWSTAAVVLFEVGDRGSAEMAGAKAAANVDRMRDLLNPRIRGAAPVLVNHNSRLRRGRRRTYRS